MAKPIQLVLLTGPQCPLCDEMKEELARFKSIIPFNVHSIDIEGHEPLKNEYWDRIPYLFVHGRPFAKGRLNTKELHMRIVAAKAGFKKGELPEHVQHALSL